MIKQIAQMERMGLCTAMIASYFWIANFVFVIFGLTLVGGGFVVFSVYGELDKFFESPIASPPVVLIILGSFMFCIALLGVWGAFHRQPTILGAYAISVFVILALQLTIASAVVASGTSNGLFVHPLEKEFEATRTSRAAFDVFERLQKRLHCCGVNSPADYVNNPKGPIASCCEDVVLKCTPFFTTYQPGCAQVVADVIDDNWALSAELGFGMMLLEMINVGACIYLIAFYKKNRIPFRPLE